LPVFDRKKITYGRNYPSLAKRGKGRFSDACVNSILRTLVTYDDARFIKRK